MSTRKRTYAELTQSSLSNQPSSSLQQTPSRVARAPSTPHAKRALEQRSGVKQRSAARSARKNILQNNDLPRPDSARGILRRLAQLTAPLTKRRIPTPVGKENEAPGQDEDGDGDILPEKPGLSLPIYEEGVSGDDEESELPTAPTPSVLPDDDYDPTITFKSIDFARHGAPRPMSEKIDRRISRVSSRGGQQSDEEDEDITADITAEMGRRAMSEGPPTGRFPRGSFGSIRMSDFGTELEVRRSSDFRKGKGRAVSEGQDYDGSMGIASDEELEREVDAETENLRRLQRSASRFSDNDTMPMPAMGDEEETFRLDMPDEEQAAMAEQSKSPRLDVSDDQNGDHSSVDEADARNGPEAANSPLFVFQSPSHTRRQIHLEMSAVQTYKRTRKPLKLTRHGHPIPSLPSSLIKRIATESQTRIGKRKPQLGREHMKALEQATEWFFEQVGDDLETFSSHAKRKKRVDETDVLMLMKRQRICRDDGELQGLATEWLMKDVARELDLPDQL